MIIKKGVSSASGYATGIAFVVSKESFQITKYLSSDQEVSQELMRLKNAIGKVETELGKMIKYFERKNFPSTLVQIVESHIELIKDKFFIMEVWDSIKDNNYTAEYAISDSIRKKIKSLDLLPSSELTSKIKESLIYVRNTLMGYLTEKSSLVVPDDGEWIVVAENLTPTETLQFEKKKILGICLDKGGRTSHTALVAASLGIPCIVALKNLTSEVASGDTIIVDGADGTVIINPDQSTKEVYKKKEQQFFIHGKKLQEREKTVLPVTKDGFHVKLLANIEFPEEVKIALDFGAEGIGLYRTEFLFNGSKSPSEDEHFSHYKRAIQLLGERELVIRTADLGADKYLAGSNMVEPNPFMGLRGIRFSLENIQIFRPQLRALVRVSMLGDIKVMIPLVNSVQEVIKVKSLLNETLMEMFKDKNINSRIKVGIMLETPAACLMADLLAKHVDFFSIGTNDLIAYLLAVDRTNEMVSQLYQVYHPVLIRLLNEVVEVSRKNNRDVSICGEVAGDPLYTQILIGMGFNRLSMVPHRMPQIKRIICTSTRKECKLLLHKALKMKDSESMEPLLKDSLERVQKSLTNSL